MRHRKELRAPEQVRLFQPVATGPGWFDLDEDVRHRTTKLLGRLLRERRERERNVRVDSEGTHD